MRQRTNGMGENGFTLLEVVVSLSLLGLLFAAVFGVFAAGMRSSRASSDATRASIEAERIVAEVLSNGVRPDVRRGVTESGYRWIAEVKPDQSNVEGMPAQLFRVRVSVAWPSGSLEKQLELTTLALAQRIQPPVPDATAVATQSSNDAVDAQNDRGRGPVNSLGR